MSDIVQRLVFDDSAAIESLDKLTGKVENVEKGFEELNKEIGPNAQKAAKQGAAGVDQYGKALEDGAKKQREMQQSTVEAIKSYTVFGISINGIKEAFSKYFNILKGGISIITNIGKVTESQAKSINTLAGSSKLAAGGLTLVTRGLNIMKAALISTGIGALVIALGSLIAFLTSTQRGIDAVSAATAGIRAAFAVATEIAAKFGEKIFEALKDPQQAIKDFGELLKEQIINRIKGVIDLAGAAGKALVKLAKLDLKGAGEEAKKAGTAFVQMATGLDAEQQANFNEKLKDGVKAIKDAAEEAIRLERRWQALKDAQIAFIEVEANLRAELEKQRNISRDITKTLSERIEAARKASGIEQQIADKKIQLAETELEIIRDQNKATENLRKDNEREAQAAAAVANAKAESSRIQIRLTQQINALTKEALDSFNSMSKELLKLSVNLGLIDDAELRKLNLLEQIKTVEDMIIALENMGDAIDKDVVSEIGKAKDILELLYEGLKRPVISPVEPIRKDFEKLKSETEKPFTIKAKVTLVDPNDGPTFLKNLEEILGKLGESLTKFFDDPKVAGFLDGAFEFWNQYSNIAAEAFDNQIRAFDRLIDANREKRLTLEKDLDKELELQKLGLANNADLKQQEVDNLLAEERRLQAEQEEIQEKARKAQAVFDTAQQTGALITSAANIFRALSPLGLLGTGLAIAATGKMFAFFAKTKIQAAKATRLYTGADKIGDHFGEVAPSGKTDIPGRGEGYRVIDAVTGKDTNVRISGREMLLPEGVTAKNRAFFKNLKNGMYDFDIAERLARIDNLGSSDNMNVVNQSIVNVQGVRKQWVPFVDKKGRQGAKLMEVPANEKGSVIWFDM